MSETNNTELWWRPVEAHGTLVSVPICGHHDCEARAVVTVWDKVLDVDETLCWTHLVPRLKAIGIQRLELPS